MKLVGLILVCILILGCGGSGGDSGKGEETIVDIEFSGTWIMRTEREAYSASVGEYISSTFFSETYVMEDTKQGVRYELCNYYGGIPGYGIKTDERFYLNSSENGFSINSEGVLEQMTDYTLSWEPEYRYRSIQNPVKKSDSISLDNGTLIIQGPVSVEEYTHVCIWSVSYSTGNRKSFEIMTPYDDSYISLRFDIYDEIGAGIYQYTNSTDSTQISIDIMSTSTSFGNITGNSSLFPSNVTIELIEYNDTKISGTFSFTGQDSANYSGEFEAYFN